MSQSKPEPADCQEENFEIITTHTRLSEVLALIRADGREHALDFETTSLVPREGKVRITSIYGPAGWFVVDHFKADSFEDCVEALVSCCSYAVFNIGFEGRWFDHYSPETADLYDVAFMPKAKLGGGFNLTLAQMIKRDLKIDVSKELQSSNWDAAELTPEQYRYAGLDAYYTYKLWAKWLNELSEQQWAGFLVFNDAWRATVEVEDTSLQLDVKYHKVLLAHWTRRRDVALRYVRKWAPESALENCNSDKQLGAFFRDNILDDSAIRNWPITGKTKQMDMSREVLIAACRVLPYPMNRWVAALVIMRKMNKYISTYGQSLIDSQEKYGRVKSRLNIAAAATGRYSSSAANLQNIPSSPVVRRSFVADASLPMSGDSPYCFVMADYSSVEIRVLAAISGDDDLMHEAIYGDVHAASAADMMHISAEAFKAVLNDKFDRRQMQFKVRRRKAKSLSFGVTYGAGIPSIALKMGVSEVVAKESFDSWGRRYPKAFAYRQIMFENLMRTGFIEVADGRSIYVFKDERTLPVAANYGIQGAAASVMLRAMYHLRRLLLLADLPFRIAASVHDEILLWGHKTHAEEALALLENAMALGWLDIFPGTSTENLADAKVGLSWAAK